MLKKEAIIKSLLWLILIVGAAACGSVGFEFPAYSLSAAIGFLLVAALFYCGLRQIKNETVKAALSREQERARKAEELIEQLQQHVAEQETAVKSLRDSKEKFRHAAFHDALTNLPNRNLFIETLKFLLEKTKQTPNYKFAVLLLNLNRFKTINESLGHSTGDKLIMHVAKRLANSTREGDLVARFGRDEFAVVLSSVADVRETLDFVKRIQTMISEPFIVGGRQVYTSVSVGIALGSRDYEKAEDVLRDADMAMYYAKEQEKGVEVFSPAMHTRAVNLLQMETDLRFAIERNELRAFFQPIINLDSMTLSGFEALVRWQHPQRGLVPPAEFIPVSEETGLIIPITLWMLRRCCEQHLEWQQKSPLNKTLVVSVNLSGKHFADENLVQQIGQILFDTGLDPGCLKLEITESAVMRNPETVISMLVQLKSLGVQLSIDDFGTGYSSLSYLHRFPIDTLKVDRSFVSAMEDGSENGEIVRTIVALAKTLKMNVIAEGIETIHQLHQLHVLGCEYGQGYLFSRPVTQEETLKLLEDHDRWKKILPAHSQIISTSTREATQLRLAK